MTDEERPIKTIGGWVIIVTGVHPEAQEEDLRDAFEGFGQITNIHVNMDRRSGYAKGYAFIEFTEEDEARNAVERMNGQQLLGQDIAVTWAFKEAPM
ncbi:RNA recognition motif domain containing protein [Babesia ovis]|uniref:RNA recognition motif domain containing protein n=1 Tax=Babesia ovis TaxID=5869 RepID=A0A9W5WTJ6_BABOV|nr:RNA recognition motif domain containing protein [Babesia ovis]